MVDQTFTRRASYGPSSPTVGTRGARTRRQIADAALRCFTENGFHATSVDDIARVADTSRATLYQYFTSKDSIFIELMREAGDALGRVSRRLGRLGPHAEGYDNLHWWLGEWSWVFDRYSAMLIEWANVNSPKASLRPKLIQFVDNHTEGFGSVLGASGYAGDDPTTASILTVALVNRFNYIRHVYRPGLSEQTLLSSLATAIQLYLYPETPASVLATGPRSEHRDEGHPVERPPIDHTGPLATLPRRDSIAHLAPSDGLSEQAGQTKRQLLQAAGRVFAASGYAAANVAHIVTEAKLARGTFYRYFSDKLELMTALSDEARAVMCPMFVEFEKFAADQDPRALREWLGRFLDVQQRHVGVLRAWTEGFPIDPALLRSTADVVEATSGAIRATFGPLRAYPLDRRAAGMLFAGLLEHFPNEATGTHHAPTREQIIEAQAQFVERVLLAPEGSFVER